MAMGTSTSKPSRNKGPDMNMDPDQIGIDLGEMPSEVLQRVLTFVPDKDLKECLSVCHTWKEVISEQSFWKQKCESTGRYIEKYMAPYYPSDWKEFYFKSPFTKNLIKNCSGQDSRGDQDMKGWTVLKNGGNRWKVEENCPGSGKPPAKLLALSGGKARNFATSYGMCEREQIIDLLEEGFSEQMLDELQPDIFVSEWYAARFDCGNMYEFGVQLLKAKPWPEGETGEIQQFSFGPLRTEQWANKNWKQVTHTFQNYGPGVRLIRYWDNSVDTQFWAGHYGGKVAGSEVRFLIGKPSESA